MNEGDLIQLLTDAGPSFLLAFFIVTLVTGRWFVLRRELDKCEERNKELEGEKDEYKNMVLKSLNLGERVAQVAEERRS